MHQPQPPGRLHATASSNQQHVRGFQVARDHWPATSPNAIFVMLVGLGLASSLLAGFGMGGSRVRSWLHVVGFSAAVAVALFVITDLEFPRLGFIRIDDFDRVLQEILASMK